MTVPGQKRRFDRRPMTSGLPSATDLGEMRKRVRFVPTADSCAAANGVSTQSPHQLGRVARAAR